jgi:hypothetical protein
MAPVMRVALVVGLVLAAATAQAGPELDHQDRLDRIDQAAERVLDARFQAAPTGYRDDLDVEELEKRLREHRDRGGGGGGYSGGTPGGAGALSPIISMLMWALLIAGGVIVIFYVVRELGRGGKRDARASDPAIAEEPIPTEARLDAPLEDADRLAREGRYAEAIHTLLLRTFQELARAAASKVQPHLTSREILAGIPMLADGRDALGELVAVVELTWFGDDIPGEADWLRCRAQFDRFVAIHRAASASAGAPRAEAAA